MDILVTPGHPRPGSFNHAIADTVCGSVRRKGHRAVLHDLYAEGDDLNHRYRRPPRC
jgi:NAD(P)H dehydrogenase (quinone)